MRGIMLGASGRKFWIGAALLAAVLAPAVIARVYVVRHAEIISRDGTIYLQMAHLLGGPQAASVIENFDYPPGYPAAILAAATVSHADWPAGWVTAAQTVSVLMSLLALVSIYYIGLRAFDRQTALLTVLLLGLAQPYIALSSDAISDSQGVALAAAAVAMGLLAARRLAEQSPWALPAAAMAGLAAGLGYLTRPEELLAGAVAAVLLIKQRRLTPRGRILQAASLVLLAATAAACVLPYAHAIGGFSQKKGLDDFAMGSQACAWLLAKVDLGALPAAVRVLLDHARASIGTPVFVLAAITWSLWLGRYLLRLRLPAEIGGRPSSDGALAMLLPAAVMLPLVCSLELHRGPGYISSRHLLMPMLLLSPTIGAGLVVLSQWLLVPARWVRKPVRPRMALGVCGVGMTAILLAGAFFTLHPGKACLRQAGEKIVEIYGPGRLVLADDTRVPFFAQAAMVQFIKNTPMSTRISDDDMASMDAFVRRARTSFNGQAYAVVALSDTLSLSHLDDAEQARRQAVLNDIFATQKLRYVCQSPRVKGREPQKVWILEVK